MRKIDRRQFMEGAAAVAGGVLFPAALEAAEKKPPKATAADRVALGKTGLKPSRLGIGTGTHGGSVQRRLGRDAFIRLVRYAYDHGVTYIDTADNYRVHAWVGEAIKGLPREKLFIQSKIWGVPQKPLAEVDRFRKELGVEYIDSLLMHCVVRKDWDEERKKVMDALAEAKAKKMIRACGVSSHSIAALARAAELDWVDVVLARINPQGVAIDTFKADASIGRSDASHVEPVLKQIRRLRGRRCGLIGMKLIGDGTFTKAADREKSIRFVMQCGLFDAVTIGLKSTAEVDEAIERINRALADAPAAATAAAGA
jgi:hypothetical protein